MSTTPLSAAELEAALANLPPMAEKDRRRGRKRHNDHVVTTRRIRDARNRNRLPRGYDYACGDPLPTPNWWIQHHQERNPDYCWHHYRACGSRRYVEGYWRKNRFPGCLWCHNSCPDYSYMRHLNRVNSAREIAAGIEDWEASREEPELAEPVSHSGGRGELHTRSWDSYC